MPLYKSVLEEYMNKKVVTLMVVLVSGSLLLTGCSTSIPFVAKTYTIEGSKVSSLIVDVRDREIEVSVSNDGLVHIDYFENEIGRAHV